MRKIRLFVFSIMIMMLMFCCCSLNSKAAVSLSMKKVYLTEGESYRLYVYGKKKSCTWSSTNKRVATVGKKGKVKAKNEGKATIRAKIKIKTKKKTKTKIKKCTVYVEKDYYDDDDDDDDYDYDDDDDKNKTYSYKLSDSNLQLEVGSGKWIDVENKNFFDDVEWTSNNTSVVKIINDGYIKAVGEGKAVVTASIDGWKATCEVNVYKKLKIESYRYEISYHSSVKILPDIETYTNLICSSSDENIATVQNGIIYGKNPGEAEINVSYLERKYTLHVTVGIFNSDISYGGGIAVYVGTQGKIPIEIINSEVAKDFTLTYESDDTEICDVDQNGVVYAKKRGWATVKIRCGDIYQRNCSINVFDLGFDDEIVMFEPGDSEYYCPRGIEGAACTVKSNNESVIKVSQTGNQFYLESQEPGRTTLTITYKDITVEQEIYVRLHVPDAIKTQNYVGFNEYEQATLKAARAAIDSVISPNMTTSQKVKAIHDYIVLNCDYDYQSYLNGTIPNESYTYVGVFKNRVAVCNGYSQAFMLCMKVLDIPCRFVGGYANGSHSWNQVYVDGTWYYIDTTWDDPIINGNINPNYITWNYYLTTSIWKDHTVSYAEDVINFDMYLNPNEIIFFSLD